mgnify:CR=1 FL=1
MSAEERERDLLTAVALLQATLSARELRIESLESELKATRTVDHDAERRLQMLEIALEDARNAYENLKGILEMNHEMHTADRESWWRDRDSLIAERDREREKLSRLQRVEGDSDQLRIQVRDLKYLLASFQAR